MTTLVFATLSWQSWHQVLTNVSYWTGFPPQTFQSFPVMRSSPFPLQVHPPWTHRDYSTIMERMTSMEGFQDNSVGFTPRTIDNYVRPLGIRVQQIDPAQITLSPYWLFHRVIVSEGHPAIWLGQAVLWQDRIWSGLGWPLVL